MTEANSGMHTVYGLLVVPAQIWLVTLPHTWSPFCKKFTSSGKLAVVESHLRRAGCTRVCERIAKHFPYPDPDLSAGFLREC